MTIDSVLSKLMEFRMLPTYQFERRLDAFILPYLENVFNNIFSTPDRLINDFVLVYAEFPLRTIDMNSAGFPFRDDKSACYGDYLMWSKTLNIVFIVEFKTDQGSIGDEQFLRYVKNCEAGWRALMENYIQKTDSKKWQKFRYGLTYIHRKAPELMGHLDENALVKLKEISGKGDLKAELARIAQGMKFNDEPGVAFIYIAPQSSENSLKNLFEKYREPTSNAPFISLSVLSQYVDEPLKSLLREIDRNT